MRNSIRKPFNISIYVKLYASSFLGHLISLRHQKTEVDTIKKSVECGAQLDDEQFIARADDKLICYTMKKDKLKIVWKPAGF